MKGSQSPQQYLKTQDYPLLPTVQVYLHSSLTFMWVKWSVSGCSGLVAEYSPRNREVVGLTHTRSSASNLEQVSNRLCAQANSASYPQWDGKWVVATAMGLRPSVADWGMVCLLPAPWVQLSVSASNGWPHNAVQHHRLMPISCHFRDCKAQLVTSLTHVSGAIASVQTFTFTFKQQATVVSSANALLLQF